MIRLLPIVTGVVFLALSFALDGRAPLAHLATTLGAFGIAERLYPDPAWAGVAAHRAGSPAAITHYTQAGDAFNLGVAAASAGQYAAALEAFDRAAAANPQDWEAAENFNLVATYYGGTALLHDSIDAPADRPGDNMRAPEGRGAARATGTGDQVTNTGPNIGLPDLKSDGLRRVRKVFDEKFVVAGPRWLEALPDVPGEYLKARIAAEHKRRKKAGLSPAPPEDPS